MGLWKCYIRWRHSKGFGVHSPYAYRFVTDVLRPGHYRYYSYQEVDKFLQGKEIQDFRLIKLIRFTIRMVIFLHSERIVVIGNNGRFAQIAARALHLKYKDLSKGNPSELKEGDLLILAGTGENKTSIEISVKNAVNHKVPVFALNPTPFTKEILEKPLQKGLLLNGGNRILMVPREEMEYVSYDINLGPFLRS